MKFSLSNSVGASAGALLTSSATLICCVLPAVLVSIGAGATLVSLVSAIPQLVWLSGHKLAVFGVAGAMLVVSGMLLWNARRLPCPIDPNAAAACARSRRLSHILFGIAACAYLLATTFAFLLPILI